MRPTIFTIARAMTGYVAGIYPAPCEHWYHWYAYLIGGV